MAATWDDVSAIARELPSAVEGIRFDDPMWKVGKNIFVWVRALRARDLEELGDAAPTGAIIGASTADTGERSALIDEDSRAFFVDRERLREVVTDAWLARAPKRLAADFERGFTT